MKKGDTVDVHIIGATKSTGSIPFGALLMEKDGKYFGKVGTGFSDQDRVDILKLLKENQEPLKDNSAFRSRIRNISHFKTSFSRNQNARND